MNPVIQEVVYDEDYQEVTSECEFVEDERGRYVYHEGKPICKLICDGTYFLWLDEREAGHSVWRVLRKWAV